MEECGESSRLRLARVPHALPAPHTCQGVLAGPGTPRDPKSHLFVTNWVAIQPFWTFAAGFDAEFRHGSRQGCPAPSISNIPEPCGLLPSTLISLDGAWNDRVPAGSCLVTTGRSSCLDPSGRVGSPPPTHPPGPQGPRGPSGPLGAKGPFGGQGVLQSPRGPWVTTFTFRIFTAT